MIMFVLFRTAAKVSQFLSSRVTREGLNSLLAAHTCTLLVNDKRLTKRQNIPKKDERI